MKLRLPPEIWERILSYTDIETRVHFARASPHLHMRNMVNALPRDERHELVETRAPIRLVIGKFHPGLYGYYAEAKIPKRPFNMYITVLPLRRRVLWSSYIWDRDKREAGNQIHLYIQ
jgi:hypothetical protein